MEWQEINCIIEALILYVEKYNARLQDVDLDEDERSDVNNDLAYAQILLGSYKKKRDSMNSD